MWRLTRFALLVLSFSLFLALVSLAPAAGAASGDLLWARHYNTSPAGTVTWSEEPAVSAIGDVFIAGDIDRGVGHSWDWVVVRYTSAGNRKWTRLYGGSGKDVLSAVAADRFGNVVACGSRAGTIPGESGFVVIKYSRVGTLKWARRIDGTAAGSADVARAVAVDAAGNVYATGEVEQSTTGRDILTVKYSPSGQILWRRVHNSGGARDDGGWALARDDGGNVYVAAEVEAHWAGSGQDVRVIRYRADGFRDWAYTWGLPDGSDDIPADIAVRDAGVAVCGTSWPAEQGFVIKRRLNGQPGWSHPYTAVNDGVSGSSWLRTGIDADGRVAVAGYTEVGTKVNGPDYAVHRFSKAGVRLNEFGEVGSATELAEGLAVTAGGVVFATGHGPYDGLRHPRTVSLAATWAVRWNTVYTFQEQDVCEGLTLGNGCVYVGGKTYNGDGTGASLLLIKYQL